MQMTIKIKMRVTIIMRMEIKMTMTVMIKMRLEVRMTVSMTMNVKMKIRSAIKMTKDVIKKENGINTIMKLRMMTGMVEQKDRRTGKRRIRIRMRMKGMILRESMKIYMTLKMSN